MNPADANIELPSKRWLIKNPAPTDSRMQKWGDYHVGRSLTKYLERMGQHVETVFHSDWERDIPCDIVLVLRGLHAHRRLASQSNAIHLMWNISHPSEVTLEEYNSFDLVFVASETLSKSLSGRLQVPVVTLLQATDHEEFFPPGEAAGRRRGVVFVGNTRDVARPGVLWAIEAGLEVRIWGRGWESLVPSGCIQADYFPNEELGLLYQRSAFTINDHWPDMRQSGFINNRVFDALACGLPVISDWHASLHRLFPDEVLYYRDQKELNRCLERVLLSYPSVLERARRASERVRSEYTYERRARTIARHALSGVHGFSIQPAEEPNEPRPR